MIKVLIVDDEAAVTDSLTIYLKNNGFEAYGAKNSNQAFEVLEKHKPDILILDINLREKYTGIDVLKKAKELDPNVKAAMLTGSEDEQMRQEALDCGAKMIIEKPIMITKFRQIIDQLAKT